MYHVDRLLLHTPFSSWRTAALRRIAKYPERKVARIEPSLVWAAGSVDAVTREYAIYALGKLSPAGHLDQFVKAIQDQDAAVRICAIHGLLSFEVSQSMPQLIEAVHDPEPEVCTAAIRALGQARVMESVSAIAERLAGQGIRTDYLALDRRVRRLRAYRSSHPRSLEVDRIASDALVRIGGDTARRALVAKINDWVSSGYSSVATYEAISLMFLDFPKRAKIVAPESWPSLSLDNIFDPHARTEWNVDRARKQEDAVLRIITRIASDPAVDCLCGVLAETVREYDATRFQSQPHRDIRTAQTRPTLR